MILADYVISLGRQVELAELSLADAVTELHRLFPDLLSDSAAADWVKHWRSADVAALPAVLRIEAGG